MISEIQKDHIYHTKQYQAFYRKIKCDFLNFRGVQNGYHRDFQYLMVSIHFFHEVAKCKVLCLINYNREKSFSDFFDGKTLLYP